MRSGGFATTVRASLEDHRRETLRMSGPLWWSGIVNVASLMAPKATRENAHDAQTVSGQIDSHRAHP